ncbi:uncharacterized protein LOC116187176 [Punica granatum]|uniref:Uncharacterized protein n=2 Tax=Punica granatum TaxID=22663 RepID=A0A218XR56_PUNGR|nr:uncharacterized protein LOC116187176 [Punica granatum]OWM87675.1 hypothetical protein CDL15_Pgr022788 [Punica granatum]PKI43011.1 hypothetical protein CRG98_036589 [Punica granatum]
MFRFKFFMESLQFSLSMSLRSLSTSVSRPPKTLTAEYLISSHGFPQEAALTLANIVAERGRSGARFDSVITLFKNYGFTPASMASIFISYPNVLSAKAHGNIKPKLDFLSKSGLSGDTLVHVICNDPFILMRSLEGHLAPCMNSLIKFFGSREDLVSLFLNKRGSWALRNYSEAMELNINTLRAFGVSNSGIAKLITLRVRALSRTPSEFRAILDKIKQMGLDPSSMMFIYGVCSCAGMKDEKWDAKVNVFYKYGFSEAQFRALFVKQPGIMNSSMKRLEKMLNYLMNDLGWTVDYITSYPIVLMSSLEKKIMPRVQVFMFLLSEGLVKQTAVGRAAVISEAEFYKFFLVPHGEKLPQILEMYKSKKVLSS